MNNGNIKTIRPGTPDDREREREREHCITLPPPAYKALFSERLEITSRVLAHIIWDNDNCRLIILG